MSGWHTHRVEAGTPEGPGVTVHELDSGQVGPVVLVLGGVHGDEVGGIVAAGRLTGRELSLRTGRLRVVPVVHEDAYGADSRTSPLDGANLARAFPGDVAGGPTEQLAALVAERLIRHSDVLIDLHTSSPASDMPFFAGCVDDGGDVATRAVELTAAFGAGLLWTHPSLAPGRTLSFAHAQGIPAIYAESPAGGVLHRGTLDAYETGVVRVLAHLGMLRDDHPPAPPPPNRWLHGPGDVDGFTPAPAAGLFLADVALLDEVSRGQRVGRILDPRGHLLGEVTAARSGHVVTLRRRAHVAAGTPVVGVAAPRPAVLGTPSDALAERLRAAAMSSTTTPNTGGFTG